MADGTGWRMKGLNDKYKKQTRSGREEAKTSYKMKPINNVRN